MGDVCHGGTVTWCQPVSHGRFPAISRALRAINSEPKLPPGRFDSVDQQTAMVIG